MNQCPVAGIDVSKRFSDLCILSPENKVYARSKIYHDLTSMERASGILLEAEKQFSAKPILVMEATSHYHLILFQFFDALGYEVIVVNPLQSSSMKDFEIRKRKTDKVDAFKLAMLYRTRMLRPSQIPLDAIRALRLLCRERTELLNDVTRYKNRLTSFLDQIFPGYDKIFSDIGGITSRAVLNQYPTPRILLAADRRCLVELIANASGHGYEFAFRKADLLIQTAQTACTLGVHSVGDASVILSVVPMLDTLYEGIGQIERTMDELVAQVPEIQRNEMLLQSIPGVGKHSSRTILAEMGDISLFHKPKQLAAYFGLDPSERQSGTFRGSKNKLSKRGSPYARAALHMATHNAVCKHGSASAPNPVLAKYYEKKCNSKPAKVALSASMHKLVFIIFAVLRDQKPFELRTPEQHAISHGFLSAA